MTIYPSSATFATAVGQTSSPVSFLLTNAGDTSVGPLSVTITGAKAADFAATTSGCDLVPPLGTCTITVVYTPPKQVPCGSGTASLVVTGPAPDFTIVSAGLLGGGPTPNPIVLTSPATDFGSVAVGTTSPTVMFTLSYLGDLCSGETAGPLALMLSSAEFFITDDTCSTNIISEDQPCTFGVAFRPTSTGAKTATLSVTSESGHAAVTTLTGTGTTIDASIVAPDAAVLDGSSEAAGEAGQAG